MDIGGVRDIAVFVKAEVAETVLKVLPECVAYRPDT